MLPLKSSKPVRPMHDPLTVQSLGEIEMNREQAKLFAVSIYAGVKAYLQTHRAEFEQWLQEQPESGESATGRDNRT